MTKKDYVMIADIIRHSKTETNMPSTWYITEMLAKELKRRNPKFDMWKFKKLCGFSKTRG